MRVTSPHKTSRVGIMMSREVRYQRYHSKELKTEILTHWDSREEVHERQLKERGRGQHFDVTHLRTPDAHLENPAMIQHHKHTKLVSFQYYPVINQVRFTPRLKGIRSSASAVRCSPARSHRSQGIRVVDLPTIYMVWNWTSWFPWKLRSALIPET